MSRPRKPFGANHPGRLPATMMKVLAAEMSDPSRLRRGKQYAKDGSVLDIVGITWPTCFGQKVPKTRHSQAYGSYYLNFVKESGIISTFPGQISPSIQIAK